MRATLGGCAGEGTEAAPTAARSGLLAAVRKGFKRPALSPWE